MAGALGMEKRETMKRYSKMAKEAELGGDVGGEAEGGAKFSLEIWGQILKARRGERVGEEAGGGGRERIGPRTQNPQFQALLVGGKPAYSGSPDVPRCSGSSGGGSWSVPGCEVVGQPLHLSALVSSSVTQAVRDTWGLRGCLRLRQGGPGQGLALCK